jgi:hypothetical protein
MGNIAVNISYGLSKRRCYRVTRYCQRVGFINSQTADVTGVVIGNYKYYHEQTFCRAFYCVADLRDYLALVGLESWTQSTFGEVSIDWRFIDFAVFFLYLSFACLQSEYTFDYVLVALDILGFSIVSNESDFVLGIIWFIDWRSVSCEVSGGVACFIDINFHVYAIKGKKIMVRNWSLSYDNYCYSDFFTSSYLALSK